MLVVGAGGAGLRATLGMAEKGTEEELRELASSDVKRSELYRQAGGIAFVSNRNWRGFGAGRRQPEAPPLPLLAHALSPVPFHAKDR